MLDCQTEKGKIYIAHEDWTARWVEDHAKGKTELIGLSSLHPEYATDSCHADRFAIGQSGQKQALIEIKARNMTLNTFVNSFQSEYLISVDKINECKKIALKFKIPFFVFVNLIDDKYILKLKVLNKNGEFVIGHRIVRDFRTQKTCNGGSKLDDVYFLKTYSDNIIHK